MDCGDALCSPRDHHPFPKSPGMTRSKERDLDDLRCRAIMRTTVKCMADLHQYLVT